MKPSKLLTAAAAVALTAACNGESGTSTNGAPSGPAQTVAPPAGQSWEQVVTKTPEGGFLMGNPDAPVKLIEFGSMTCPHCADFEEDVDELVNDYVKTGQVSFEFRNFVRDPYDIAGSLITRCGGPERFFPLTDAMFATQEEWIAKLQAAPPEKMQAVMNMGPERQFVEMAQLAGFQQWAAQRGLSPAQTSACLTNEAEINQLVQMNADATEQFNIPGTPAFVINGELVPNAASWDALEPKLREADGG
jgi:protein-disulfide isomerase